MAAGRLMIEDVYVGGIVSGFRGLKTKKGDRMCVFMLEDHQGAVEVVVFPETFGASHSDRERRPGGRARQVRARRGELAVPGAEILPLAALRERLSRGVRIRMKATARVRSSRRCGS